MNRFLMIEEKFTSEFWKTKIDIAATWLRLEKKYQANDREQECYKVIVCQTIVCNIRHCFVQQYFDQQHYQERRRKGNLHTLKRPWMK